jgi:hypothetical protein
MKGDFSRVTFPPDKGYARILQQQGRVALDADWNEQSAIDDRRMRAMLVDLVGGAAGPRDALGFAVTAAGPGDVTIGPGRYYVSGWLCTNDEAISYRAQRDDVAAAGLAPSGRYLLYLEAWEQLVTAADDPTLLEPALGGADTTARTRIAWRVRALKWTGARRDAADPCRLAAAIEGGAMRPLLRVRSNPGYTGIENRLYRIEIQRSEKPASFTWSRDNGAVRFALSEVQPTSNGLTARFTAAPQGPQEMATLAPGAWVALEDPTRAPDDAAPLMQVAVIDASAGRVELAGDPGLGGRAAATLRLWDQRGPEAAAGGAVPIALGEWLKLEDGIEILFEANSDGYRTGDYWQVAARTGVGVLWPDEGGRPAARLPAGIERAYAPLALVRTDRTGRARLAAKGDLRAAFAPLARPMKAKSKRS